MDTIEKEIAILFETNRRLTVSKTSALPKVEICIGTKSFEDDCPAYGLVPYVNKLINMLTAKNPNIRLQLQLSRDTANIVVVPD